jgi:hypothetical protein
MTAKEFHQKFNDLCAEATESKDPAQRLPLFAIVGITQCTIGDMQMRAFLEMQAQAAFAARMAQNSNSKNQ